ncbi:MAG: 4Fe-4S binding protein [Treponema sp.]|jgi:formate hydrogenlyase subunit 6/NADH:ubiquinone oxidoreductase subunit I|nr:4Fe-4S binding protein [Treponema sp.]
MAFHITVDCIGCTACARACPVFAISGGKGAQHTINPKRCVECGVCGRICPKAAVADSGDRVIAAVKRSLWPKPKIDAELCSACSICVTDCTAGALKISLPTFRSDIHVHAELFAPQKCVACAICEKHCPLDAITMQAPEAAPVIVPADAAATAATDAAPSERAVS